MQNALTAVRLPNKCISLDDHHLIYLRRCLHNFHASPTTRSLRMNKTTTSKALTISRAPITSSKYVQTTRAQTANQPAISPPWPCFRSSCAPAASARGAILAPHQLAVSRGGLHFETYTHALQPPLRQCNNEVVFPSLPPSRHLIFLSPLMQYPLHDMPMLQPSRLQHIPLFHKVLPLYV